MKRIVDIGIDVGSTTVKIVVLEKEKILFQSYQRHFSNALKTVYELLTNLMKEFKKDDNFRIAFTGSGALTLAKYVELSFVQEVIACKNATLNYNKSIDVVVELGGEDAKIIYFSNGIEQRMNGSCAGGTGAFLDQMAVLLNTDTKGLNELATKGEKIYPIASRCGVFAKSDIQPLINEGAKKEDIALSIMQAVVNQTISGLACGKPIRGNVMFLGGPLNYLDTLRNAFIKTLNLREDEAYVPTDGHLFVAKGAIYANKEAKAITYKEVVSKLKKMQNFKEDNSVSLQPLFENMEELDKFTKRHAIDTVKKADITSYQGNAYLGIDAGSTTAKLVLIDEDANILYEDYRSNLGSPIDTIKSMILDMYKIKPISVIIRVSGSTGYGEELIKTAFNLDISEIETMAHMRAAEYFNPSVSKSEKKTATELDKRGIKFKTVARQNKTCYPEFMKVKNADKTDPLHSSLGIIDRVIRTIRDMAYVMQCGIITPEIMYEIVHQYNNAPHRGLSRWAGFAVTPKMVQDDYQLEEFIIRRISRENNSIMAQIGYTLPVGTPVRIYNEKDTMLKRRSQVRPGKFRIVGEKGSLYQVADENNKIHMIPRYKITY